VYSTGQALPLDNAVIAIHQANIDFGAAQVNPNRPFRHNRFLELPIRALAREKATGL
jgi:hypothetical protein